MTWTIEKSFDVSENTKYAFYYSPRLICSCEIRCKFRSVNGKLKRADKVGQDSGLQDDLFKTYREKNQIDLDSNQSSSYSNYQENILSNLTFYLRLLNVSDRSTCSNSWHTCSDSPVYKPFPMTQDLSHSDFDHLSLLDSVHSFLNKIDQRQLQKCLNVIFTRDPVKKIFNNFSNLNKRLFNEALKGIVCRWSDSNSNFQSEFDLEESCDGRLMWTIKLNRNTLGKETVVNILKNLIFEMALAFVNVEINKINYDFKEQNEIILKMEKSLKNLLKKISTVTALDIRVPFNTRPFVYNYCLISENTKSNNCLTRTTYKFMSYNPDDSVLIEPVGKSKSDVQYETIKCCHQADNEDMSADYAVLSRVTNHLVQSVSEDVFINSQDDVLSSTIVDHEYDLLGDCYSDKFEQSIIQNSTLIVEGGSVQNLVGAPFRRSRTGSKKPSIDLNNNDESHKLSDAKLNRWMENLNGQSKECRSVPLFGLDQTNESDDEQSRVSRVGFRVGKNNVDENVILLRNAVFSYINESLKDLINSPTKLENFRKNVVLAIEENGNSSIENFVQDMFDLFSNTVFHKIVKNVRLEWSGRLRSTAASTILDKSLDQSTGVVIRLATNLLNKLSRVDLIQILLHEMIHAFLGLAIGDFDPGHTLSFRKILNKLNCILKLDIPIEHEYAETLELAHVWQCTKCEEKRIRFYNIPPTDNQRGEHASK
ncbi:sprT-like domain-containing Spartan, partial [Brachionus plicatilis]